MFLGYDFKDPVAWARERMSSKRRYRQEIATTVIVGVATLAVLVFALLIAGVTSGRVMLTVGIAFLVVDCIILRGVVYAMALRRLVLGRQPKGEGASDEKQQSKEDEA